MNIKDSVRFALIIFVLLLSFVSWRNQTIAEKIFYGIIVWIYSFIALLYANPENMKEKYKKNKFYGWSFYFISILCQYNVYRFCFNGFSWLILIYIVYFFLQNILWIIGVKKNIKKDAYKEQEGLYFNLFTFFSIVLLAGICIFSLIYLIYMSFDWRVICIAVSFFLIGYTFLLGLTFIYQNYLIKKYSQYS